MALGKLKKVDVGEEWKHESQTLFESRGPQWF